MRFTLVELLVFVYCHHRHSRGTGVARSAIRFASGAANVVQQQTFETDRLWRLTITESAFQKIPAMTGSSSYSVQARILPQMETGGVD